MNVAARRKLQEAEPVPSKQRSNGNHRGANGEAPSRANGAAQAGRKVRVFIAAENRLLREALTRMLAKLEDMDVVGLEATEPFRTEDLLKEEAGILLLSSRGTINEDLLAIRKVRAASAEDVVEGIRALRAGEAVCPGTFCAALFRYLEREATSFPSASVHQRLGLTRREQQLIPLIAEGLTNQEIANRFCLSEQTVKNHLYRMKHKVGAEDRLGIVQVCRTQGFMV